MRRLCRYSTWLSVLRLLGQSGIHISHCRKPAPHAALSQERRAMSAHLIHSTQGQLGQGENTVEELH